MSARSNARSDTTTATATAAPAAREVPIRTQRSARFYTLGGRDDGAMPAELWIVLHGYGQLAGRFIRHFRAIAGPDRLIVAPEALNRFYVPGPGGVRSHAAARVGATWMTREDREREIEDQQAYLDGVLAAVCAPWDGATPRLVVLGFSQGVATGVRWISHSAVNVARIIAWGGALPGEIDAPTAARHVEGRLTFVAGRTDELIPEQNVAIEIARLAAIGLHAPVVWHEGGHVMDAPTLDRVARQER